MNDSIMGRMHPVRRAKVYYAVGIVASLSGTLAAECVSDVRLPLFLIFFPAALFLFFSLCHEIGFMIRRPRS